MKKLIIVLLLVVACFAMCSCVQNVQNPKVGNPGESEGYKREVRGVTHYEYEGHHYLIFTCNTDHYSVGVVHDPTCWCRKHIIYYVD